MPATHSPTRTLQPSPDNLPHITAIQVGALDDVQSDVRPEHQLLLMVEVKGYGILQPLQDGRVLSLAGRQLADVNTVGKDEVGLPSCGTEIIYRNNAKHATSPHTHID